MTASAYMYKKGAFCGPQNTPKSISGETGTLLGEFTTLPQIL